MANLFKAAERDYAKTGLVEKEVKYTEENLDAVLNRVRKVYGNKRPVDLDGYRGKTLAQHAETLFKAFSWIRGRILALLRMDLSIEMKLKRHFAEKSGVGFKISLLQQKKKLREIKGELDAVVKYYAGIKKNGRLPRLFLRRFNKMPIIAPILIEEQDLKSLAEIDRKLRTSVRRDMVRER